MKRKFSLVLLVVILLNATNLVLATDFPNMDTSSFLPEIIFQEAPMPEGIAGKILKLNLTLENKGYSGRDIRITPDLPEGSPFVVDGLTGTTVIKTLGLKKTEKLNLSLKVSEKTKGGVYPLNFKFNFKNQYGDSGSSTETIYVRIKNNQTSGEANLVVKNPKTSVENLFPGSEADLNFDIENQGSGKISDLEVTLDNLNTTEGFYVVKGSNKTYLKEVKGFENKKVNYRIKAAGGASIGGHELVVNLKYKLDGQIVEEKQSIFLNVGKKGAKSSKVSIHNLKYSTSPHKPGQNFNISLNIRNTGALEAKNIIVKLESNAPEAVVPKTQSIRKIDSLKKNQTIPLNFSFMPTNQAQTMNYPISITVEYEDELNAGGENKYIINQYAGILVSNPPKPEAKPKPEEKPKPEQPQHKPKLIIDKYTIDPVMVMAGEDFTMKLSFFNTNDKKAVKNIKIFLTSDEKTEEDASGGGNSVFTPVETSNTFYIDHIAPKGRVEKTIKMFAMPDAKAKTYTITANFEYEDAKAQEFTATELIGVPVIQKSRLDLGQMNIPTELYMNEAGPISVEFFNTGKVTLYNLMVRLEGDFEKENASYYVGNFEVGNSDTFDASIIPNREGKLDGEIVFTYEDATGELIERRESFSSQVSPGMDMNIDDMGEFPEEVQESAFKRFIKSPKLWGLLILVLGGFGGFKFYKKKKQEDSLEDEGLDSDE